MTDLFFVDFVYLTVKTTITVFFELFFFRSFNTNVMFLCCYVTLHIQHRQPLSDEKNGKNQGKYCFTSLHFVLQSIIVYLNSYQSSIFFSGNGCLNPHLLVNQGHESMSSVVQIALYCRFVPFKMYFKVEIIPTFNSLTET